MFLNPTAIDHPISSRKIHKDYGFCDSVGSRQPGDGSVAQILSLTGTTVTLQWLGIADLEHDPRLAELWVRGELVETPVRGAAHGDPRGTVKEGEGCGSKQCQLDRTGGVWAQRTLILLALEPEPGRDWAESQAGSRGCARANDEVIFEHDRIAVGQPPDTSAVEYARHFEFDCPGGGVVRVAKGFISVTGRNRG